MEIIKKEWPEIYHIKRDLFRVLRKNYDITDRTMFDIEKDEVTKMIRYTFSDGSTVTLPIEFIESLL